MPLFLIILGLILVVSGVRGTTKDVFTLFSQDAQAFIVWFFLIVVIGLVGISKTLRPVSNGFLVLILVVFFLKNGQQLVTNVEQTLSI